MSPCYHMSIFYIGNLEGLQKNTRMKYRRGIKIDSYFCFRKISKQTKNKHVIMKP